MNSAAKKLAVRRGVDALMTLALLLLMSYSLIGETVHEWIGTGMGVLFLVHLFMNRGWLRQIGRGRYTPYRIFQTLIAAGCFLTMAGLMVSGILLSNHVFSALRVRGMTSVARQMHMVCSFWGFALMSLHLGLHWSMVLRITHRLSAIQVRLLRALGWLTAIYGAFAFWKRNFPDYLLLRTHFLFLDYEEPIAYFFIDYLAVMGLFIYCAHYGGKLLRGRKVQNHEIT